MMVENNSKDYRALLAGYVDGELSDEERRDFERELARNEQLRDELGEFKKLKEVTGMVRYADLPDEVWENYWQNLYRKIERGFGWIFLSLGAIILLSFGAYEALSQLFTDPTVPLWTKLGIGTAGLGVVIMLVSLVRERLFAYNRDRYKEVNK
ncbi:MAG: zf-HC2 domain-containing protein [candidate division Zixibacteria bacterium]|nr:zf-HC2 domain-containing protein [candidate division Zixibacteria bacterium]